MKRKTCRGCGIEKDITAFTYKDKASERRHARCRDCTRLQVRRHYANNRQSYLHKARRRDALMHAVYRREILAYLAGHPCVDCGESDPVCLEFDHVHGQKIQAISELMRRHRWRALEQELPKCEVRCANCHRRKTARQRGWYRSLAISSPP